jgi:hypothetical protein
MAWLLLALALYLTPVGLLVLFLIFSLVHRTGFMPAVYVVAVIGLPCDILCNYTWFRVMGPYPWRGQSWLSRTVTARVAVGARAGNPTALRLARFLNWCDPGHVNLQR